MRAILIASCVLLGSGLASAANSNAAGDQYSATRQRQTSATRESQRQQQATLQRNARPHDDAKRTQPSPWRRSERPTYRAPVSRFSQLLAIAASKVSAVHPHFSGVSLWKRVRQPQTLAQLVSGKLDRQEPRASRWKLVGRPTSNLFANLATGDARFGLAAAH